MSPSRTYSLAEAVTLLAWGQRFTAEDFMAVDGLKTNVPELRRYRQNLKKRKGPVVKSDDLKIYRHATSDGRRIKKEMKEASRKMNKAMLKAYRHSSSGIYAERGTSKFGKPIDDHLDATFAAIVKDCGFHWPDGAAQGKTSRGEAIKVIPSGWFKCSPEPIAVYDMNVMRLADTSTQPLTPVWFEVAFARDVIERLRDGNTVWPMNRRSELVTDETKPVAEKPAKPSNRGRPQKWRWDGAVGHLLSIANTSKGLTDHQADIERLVAAWFISQYDNQPSESQIREHVVVWCEEILRKDGN